MFMDRMEKIRFWGKCRFVTKARERQRGEWGTRGAGGPCELPSPYPSIGKQTRSDLVDCLGLRGWSWFIVLELWPTLAAASLERQAPGERLGAELELRRSGSSLGPSQ